MDHHLYLSSDVINVHGNSVTLEFDCKHFRKQVKNATCRDLKTLTDAQLLKEKLMQQQKNIRKGKENEFQLVQKREFLINTTQLNVITLQRVFTFYFCFNYYVHVIYRDRILHL